MKDITGTPDGMRELAARLDRDAPILARDLAARLGTVVPAADLAGAVWQAKVGTRVQKDASGDIWVDDGQGDHPYWTCTLEGLPFEGAVIRGEAGEYSSSVFHFPDSSGFLGVNSADSYRDWRELALKDAQR